MSLPRIDGQVALVTGATRGIGRGVAIQLAKAGAIVYITGRTSRRTDSQLPGSLNDTVEEVGSTQRSLTDTVEQITASGGTCIPVQCDHSDDAAVKKVFDKVKQEQNGRLDILVNNVYDGIKTITENLNIPFWEQSLDNWDAINNVGLRNHYRCTVHAAHLMVPRQQGLIVNISSVGGLGYLFNAPYGVGKAAVDRMAQDCAVDFRKENITMLSLWPGPVRTENMLAAVNSPEIKHTELGQWMKGALEVGETVDYTGRAIIYIAADQNKLSKSGRVQIVADLAQEYGFTEENGFQPLSMRSIKGLLSQAGHPWIAACVPGSLNLPKWLFSLGGNKF